jgi:hypothetical protein
MTLPNGSLGPKKHVIHQGRPLRKPLDATYDRKEFALNMMGELNRKIDTMKSRANPKAVEVNDTDIMASM